MKKTQKKYSNDIKTVLFHMIYHELRPKKKEKGFVGILIFSPWHN